MAERFYSPKKIEVMSGYDHANTPKDTTELLFASLLRKHPHIRMRRHLPLQGRPDFTFRRVSEYRPSSTALLLALLP